MSFSGISVKPILLEFMIGLPLALSAASFLQANPADLKSLQANLQVEEQNGQIGAAARSAAVIREILPWRTDLTIQYGKLLLEDGNPAEALPLLEEASTRGDFTAEGATWLGAAYLAQGQPTRAVEVWEALAEQEQASTEVLAQLAGLYRKAGNFDQAADTLDQWKSREPGNPRPLLELGYLHALTDPPRAVRELDEAAALDKEIMPQVFQLRKALKHEECDEETNCRMKVGLALSGLEQWDLAARVLEEVTGADSENAEAWAFLGEARHQSGQNGLDALKQAEKLAPDSTTMKALMALYWRREGNLVYAEKIMEKLAREDPENAVWQIELGVIAAQGGNSKLALQYFTAATALEPENRDAWISLAQFCLDKGLDLHGTGLTAARKAVLLSSQDSSALTLMGQILFTLEDYASAERFLERAIALNDRDAAAHLNLGQIYFENGKTATAYEHLTKAVRLSDIGSSTGVLARRTFKKLFPGG